MRQGPGSIEIAKQVLRCEAKTLETMASALSNEFEAAVDCCLDCRGRLILTGMGKSGLICRKIAATLASTGTPAFFLHPSDALHGDLGILADGDVLIAVSHSGESAEILKLIPYARRLGISVIAMTGKPAGRLGSLSDVTLVVPVSREADPFGFIPTASTTGALALGDALAVALLVRRGFRAEDFARNHPGGSLGRRFLTVSELMHKGDAIPSVTTRATMKGAIREISRKKLGMTTVVGSHGRVKGVITDGDVRRLMERPGDHRGRSVKDVMTASPKTVGPDELAASALRLMERHHITSLVVVEPGGSLQGVLHLHDLWRTELF